MSRSAKPNNHPLIQLEWVRPGAERALTVEISWDVCSVRVLQAWDQSSVLSHLVSPVVGEVRGALAGVIGCALTTPVFAPFANSIAMIEDIITSTLLMVDNSIGIDADTRSFACL